MDNSLSILPSDGASNEFPVLKAFQQYIDAEQAKARKRMLGLSVFFIILLVVVVVTFVLVLTTVVNRNQALSDRLLDYALKEREKPAQVVQPPVQPVAQVQPSEQDLLRPFIERLDREQAAMKALYEKQQKEAEARYEMQRKEAAANYEKQQKEAEAKAAARELARDEEIRKAKLELEKERARAKKENDRQAEIERQRRRLYPDYYRMQPESADDYVTPPPPVQAPRPAAPAPVVKQAPAGKPAPPRTVPPPAPHPKPAPSQVQPPPAPKPSVTPAPEKAAPKPDEKKEATSPLSTIKPVTYFNLEDDGVPFLLETPTQPTK